MDFGKSDKWIVKDLKGRIYGPFSVEKMRRLISKSVFDGEELVAEYPDGEFRAISKVPAFYDELLSVLSGEKRSLTDDEKRVELTRGQQEENVQKPKEAASKPGSPQTPKKEFPKAEPPKVVNRVVRESKKEAPSTDNTALTKTRQLSPPEDVIELSTQAQLKKESSNKGLVFIIAALLIIVGYILFEEDLEKPSVPSGRISLSYPKQKRETLSEADAKKRLGQAVTAFQKDTFTNYYQAQGILVSLLESGYANVDAMSLLCLTYRELWPFANQDSGDLTALSKMTQMTSQRDPVGVSTSTCRATQMVLGGQFASAEALVDSTLNAQPQAAALYEIKADLLLGRGELLTSLGYLEKALQFWPKWLKLSARKAEIFIRQNKALEASVVLKEILSANPGHASAKILLAEIEYFTFKKPAEAMTLVRTALAEDRVIRSLASRGYLLLAIQAERESKLKEAQENIVKAMTFDPTNLSAKEMARRLGGAGLMEKSSAADKELVALGEEYVRKGNFFAAQAEFKAAYELNKNNGRAAMLAAQSLWELNQGLEAIEWLKKATVADPKLIQAYILMADYQTQRFDFQGATKSLQTAQKISQQSFQVLAGLALFEFRRLNYKGAVELARRALKLYDTDTDSYMVLAQALLALGENNQAFEAASKAVSLESSNKKAHAVYAEVLATYQGVESAVTYLTELINTYPLVPEYSLALAKVYLKDDRTQEAIKTLNNVLAQNERAKEAHLLLGQAYKKMQEDRQALKAYLSAAALDPSDVTAAFRAGEVYLAMNNFPDAKSQFESVVKVNPNYPRAHYQLGRAYLLSGQAELAIREANIEKKLNPGLSEGYLLAGDAFMVARNYSKASAEYQKAVAIQPSASTYVLLARSYRLADNLDVASSLLSRAIKIEDGYPEIYKEQGAIFEARGERQEAVTAYQKYLELLPNAADKSVIEGRISSLGG